VLSFATTSFNLCTTTRSPPIVLIKARTSLFRYKSVRPFESHWFMSTDHTLSLDRLFLEPRTLSSRNRMIGSAISKLTSSIDCIIGHGSSERMLQANSGWLLTRIAFLSISVIFQCFFRYNGQV
jgi:hypothetical protein